MILRDAYPQDVPALLELAHSTFQNCFPVPVSVERSTAIVEGLVFSLSASLKIADDDGKIAGFLGATLTQLAPWFDDPIAIEVLFFVSPEYRASRAAWLLMNNFVSWAKSTDCMMAVISSRAELNGSRVGKFYSRFGFTELDTNYILRLK